MDDFIIVGAGFAGLECARNLLIRQPNAKVRIIDANAYPGGRTHMETFAGHYVPTGAGVGRLYKDKRLLKLLQRYKIPYRILDNVETSYKLRNQVDVKDIYTQLFKHRNAAVLEPMTFKEFGVRILGRKTYNAFVDSTGYSDFEKADAYDTLMHYGFDDIYAIPSVKFAFNWNDAIRALEKDVLQRGATIMYKTRVTQVYHDMRVETQHHAYNATQRVFIATTSPVARQILSKQFQKALSQPLDSIKTNPFLRIYAKIDEKHSEEFIKNITRMTVLPRPLQMIIPMASNIYMISYSDNASAYKLRHATKADLEAYVQRATGYSIKIIQLKKYFWKHGTHYFAPRLQIQRKITCKYPITLIGEAYSYHQGWTEGALAPP